MQGKPEMLWTEPLIVKSTQKFRTPNPEEHWISERLYVREWLNHPDLPDVSLAQCRVPPGVTTQLHSLSVNEIYMIKSGEGMMEKGGNPSYPVGSGDNVFIPAHTPQRITNSGTDDLIFEVLCLPRFDPDGYTSLETDDSEAKDGA